MFVVVGLGNYGEKYDQTYHNIGFMVADELAKRLQLSFDRQKFKAQIAQGYFAGQKVLIAKPLTYMNNSGESVVLIKKQYSDARIIVAVDDIDLPTGKVRYRMSGSAGTHNGLRSIVSYIGEDFERVKIGIGRDENVDLADFVLSKIKDSEGICKAVEQAVDLILQKIAGNLS